MNPSPQTPQLLTAGSTLDSFLTRFLGYLASEQFTTTGNLSAYLAIPSEQRSGDEAAIVDMRITKTLIAALGYADHEHEYNNQKGNQRPDYVVKIAEYPRQACFIVEDKNTTVPDLRNNRPQLQSYMTQFGASRGMLVNGHAILAYDQQEGNVQTPAIEIPLADAVAAWLGSTLFTQGKSGIAALEECGYLARFSALWRRFNRDSFSGLTGLIDDLTLQNEKGSNQPHKQNGKTWTNKYSRIQITAVSNENADQLTEAIKGLIGDFEDDADAQLAAIETDYANYLAASTRIPTEKPTLEQQEDSLVQDALQLMAGADAESKEYDEGLLRSIMRGKVLAGELKQIERRLYATHAIKLGKGTERDPIFVLISRVRAFADKRYRYMSKLQALHGASIQAYHHFEIWKEKTATLVFQSENTKMLRQEFLAQTAYLVIIRILLVRIMEDKKLVNRMFTNGGVALWFLQVEAHYLEHAMGRSANFLLDLAYTSAQHIYAHFFAERTVLDWYVPDRNAVIRVLHVLAGFDLKEVNRDIIGTVYNQYVEAKHKHESGMYFTPPDTVSFMLDRIGYKGVDIIGKRLIDLSCGSGGFLVEAATRLVKAHSNYWKAQGHAHIPAEHVQSVLNDIRDSLYGVDLNPFACALAETNLLIQVLDLFSIAYNAKQPASIERFHIYNSDSLSFSADTLASQAGSLPFPDDDLPVEDQIKAGLGRWREKFDFVVGNPPYVRADENDGMRLYRDRIKREYPSEMVRLAMVQKWDLFVPFVAASLNLLKPGADQCEAGKMALITSNAIETVPYCDALRELLVTKGTVEEVHFFPGVKIFADAAVQNTITVVSRNKPSGHVFTTRFWHQSAPRWGSASQAKTQSLRQSNYGKSVFRQDLPTLKIKDGIEAIALGDVFYISKGMVLNADEKTNKGGFKMEDLICDTAQSNQVAAFAGSKDIDSFGVKNIRFLEYGPGTRVPSKLSRPTFPELYDRPKLMVAEFGGFAFDDGAWDATGFLKCNHSVFLLMQWSQLAGVDNKSIRSQLDVRASIRDKLEGESGKLNLWYVLAFLNSQQMRALLNGVNRSAIAGRLQPDDLRQVSIPIPADLKQIEIIAALAKTASAIQKQLLPLRKAGWIFEEDMAVAPATVRTQSVLPLDRARIKWGLVLNGPSAKVHKLVRSGHRLYQGKQEVASIPASAPPEALEWFRRQLLTLPEGVTLGEVEQLKPLMPETTEQAKKALALLLNDEIRVTGLLAAIKKTKLDISVQMQTLFETIPHPMIR